MKLLIIKCLNEMWGYKVFPYLFIVIFKKLDAYFLANDMCSNVIFLCQT
jgi:hypothetical protein